MNRFNHFLYGFIPGLLLPIGIIYLYLLRFYPNDYGFIETIQRLYPGVIFGKLLLLGIMPNMVFVFAFYKSDSFKIATGMLTGAMPYIIASIIIL